MSTDAWILGAPELQDASGKKVKPGDVIEFNPASVIRFSSDEAPGLFACRSLTFALARAKGLHAWRFRCDGDAIEDGPDMYASRLTLLWGGLDAGDILTAFARACAIRAVQAVPSVLKDLDRWTVLFLREGKKQDFEYTLESSKRRIHRMLPPLTSEWARMDVPSSRLFDEHPSFSDPAILAHFAIYAAVSAHAWRPLHVRLATQWVATALLARLKVLEPTAGFGQEHDAANEELERAVMRRVTAPIR